MVDAASQLLRWQAAKAFCFATSTFQTQTTRSARLYQLRWLHPLVITVNYMTPVLCICLHYGRSERFLNLFFTLCVGSNKYIMALGYLSQPIFCLQNLCPVAYSYTRLKEHERLASGSRAHSSRHSFWARWGVFQNHSTKQLWQLGGKCRKSTGSR